MHEGGRFDVRRAVEKGAERLDPMRRVERAASERVRRHVTDITISRQLHPSPATVLVEDRELITEKRLGLEASRRIGCFAQRHGRPDDECWPALDVTFGPYDPFKRLCREIPAERIAPRIERPLRAT